MYIQHWLFATFLNGLLKTKDEASQASWENLCYTWSRFYNCNLKARFTQIKKFSHFLVMGNEMHIKFRSPQKRSTKHVNGWELRLPIAIQVAISPEIANGFETVLVNYV